MTKKRLNQLNAHAAGKMLLGWFAAMWAVGAVDMGGSGAAIAVCALVCLALMLSAGVDLCEAERIRIRRAKMRARRAEGKA